MGPIRVDVKHIVCIFTLILTNLDPANGLFTEELLLRPLPDGSVLAHFHFETSVASHQDLSAFPAVVARLAARTRVQHFDAALTHGRWFEDRWGKPPLPAVPVGAQLRARFLPGNDSQDTSDLWAALVHGLSGILCASFNLLEGSDVISHPAYTFPEAPTALAGGWTYGALPREIVCTENLTPWLKLLPCRGSAGLTSLMDRPTLYGAQYHSMTAALTVEPAHGDTCLHTAHAAGASHGQNAPGAGSCPLAGAPAEVGYRLVQTLTLVLDQKQRGGWPVAVHHASAEGTPGNGWSLEALFAGRKLEGRCPHAALSGIHVQLSAGLLAMQEVQPAAGAGGGNPAQDAAPVSDLTKGSVSNPPQLTEPSRRLSDPLHETMDPKYGLSRHSDSSSGDGDGGEVLTFEVPPRAASVPQFDLSQRLGHVGWPVSKPRLSAERYVTGWGEERGTLVLIVRSLQAPPNAAGAADTPEPSARVHVCAFQMVPWFLQLWLHTLHIAVDGQAVDQHSMVTSRQLEPSQSRSAAAVIELCMAAPAGFQHISVTIEFSKAFLTVFEHPPDAARGLDIPAAVVTLKGGGPREGSPTSTSPLVRFLREQLWDQVSSPGSLVQLPQPDFSMPYNVACMTCTLLGMFFGTLMNTLFRKSEADMTDAEVTAVAAKRRRKALAIIIIFSAAAFYLDRGLQRTVLQLLGVRSDS